jgi:hypothetical protein
LRISAARPPRRADALRTVVLEAFRLAQILLHALLLDEDRVAK